MADSEGMELSFYSQNDTVCAQRMGAPIDASWSRTVAKDYKTRKKH